MTTTLSQAKRQLNNSAYTLRPDARETFTERFLQKLLVTIHL